MRIHRIKWIDTFRNCWFNFILTPKDSSKKKLFVWLLRNFKTLIIKIIFNLLSELEKLFSSALMISLPRSQRTKQASAVLVSMKLWTTDVLSSGFGEKREWGNRNDDLTGFFIGNEIQIDEILMSSARSVRDYWRSYID